MWIFSPVNIMANQSCRNLSELFGLKFLKELHKYNVWQEGGSGGDWGAVSMGPPNIPDGTKIIPLKPAMRIIKCKSWSYLSCENVKIYIVFWLPWWLSR